jgi:ribonuclease HI
VKKTVVFTDGAAKGNPGPGGWGVVALTPDDQVTELGGHVSHTTNNRMELRAVIEALHSVAGAPGPIDLFSDSTYVIRGIREWIGAWRRRGWKTVEGKDVLNRDLWEALSRAVEACTGGVSWHHVRGHSRVPGNERADAIASGFAAGRRVHLYRGPLADYGIALDEVPDDTRPPAPSKGGTDRRRAAHSYLSVVDGRPMRHVTWTDCERRVKGVSGARFKKATSAADEEAILRQWGFAPEDVD